MSPDRSFLDKIDPQLQDKLAYAPENEVLRVIMRLSRENQSNINSNSISPGDFPNRTEYRKALITQRQQQLVGDIGATKKALENLALKTYGGNNTRTIVVEGTVNNILHSLVELSGIESATLDRSFASIVPSPNSSPNNVLESTFLEIAEKAKIINTATRLNRLEKFLRETNFNAEENTKQLISQASQRYIVNYYERYGIIKVLGMSKQISLDSIYTNVKFLSKNEASHFKSITDLETNDSKKNTRSHNKNYSIRKDLDIANQEQYLMVLGAPGAGKSTFLRKIGLDALRGNKQGYQHNCISVFLELNRFTAKEIDIKKIIIEELNLCGFPKAEQIVTKALDNGKLLILLDGLDTVPTKKLNSVINTIKYFVDSYDKNRFIISCRTAFYTTGYVFNRFTDVEIADFNDEQIKQYINNWFDSEVDRQEKTAVNLWSLLRQTQYQKIKELAQTPLLLTFLCSVYSRAATLPYNRSVLYERALRILLEEWAAVKMIQRNEIYQYLDTELEKILLAEIAYDNFVQNKLFFPEREIIEQIESFLTSNLDISQNINGKTILNAITIQQGILVERAYGIYSFSHFALQEYLAAQYIVDNNLIESLVSNYITDKRWQEIFLIVAGLRKADNLLLLMEEKAQQLINTDDLRYFFYWADRVTNSCQSDYNPPMKRALAIYLAISRNKSLDLAISSNYDLDFGRDPNVIKKVNTIQSSLNLLKNLLSDIPLAYEVLHYHSFSWMPNDIARDVARAISRINSFKALKIFADDIDLEGLIIDLKRLKSRVSNKNLSYEIYTSFSNEIRSLWIDAFQLKKNWIDLTSQENECISEYIEIQLLILKCKEAAVRVSKKTWEDIESRMLLPTKNIH